MFFICPGGEVVNASVCKTDMRGFDSRPGLTWRSKYEAPAQVVESVDTRDLKSLATSMACGFKSRPGHTVLF